MHIVQDETYRIEKGFRIAVQTPETDTDRLLDAVQAADPLTWGDYDLVSFTAALGVQRYRSLGTGRNVATAGRVEVPCVEISFVIAHDQVRLKAVLTAIHDAHPYEEPVVIITEAMRTLHIRGTGEDNPSRFWNRETADWLPQSREDST